MKPPRSVTILSVLVLTQSALFLTRLLLTITDWEFWQAQFLPGAAPYLAATGAVWSPVLLLLGLGLWRGAALARSSTFYLAPVYLASTWLERFVLALTQSGNPDWLFWLIANLLLLAWIYWSLSRPTVKMFFGERLYERQPQNP